MKTHLSVTPPRHEPRAACGRGKRIDTNVWRVDCEVCKKSDSYSIAMEKAEKAKREAFYAQPLRTINEPWHAHGTKMVCRVCGSDQFRIGDRTCHGHYQDYVCEAGHKESRLTETGMAF